MQALLKEHAHLRSALLPLCDFFMSVKGPLLPAGQSQIAADGCKVLLTLSLLGYCQEAQGSRRGAVFHVTPERINRKRRSQD